MWLSTFESEDGLVSNIFERTKDDGTVGLSIEDREFIVLMEKELHTDEDGHWCSPLPFRSPLKFLSNNRSMVVQRTRSLERSLKRDPVKREHFFAFIQELLDNNHAEVLPRMRSASTYLSLASIIQRNLVRLDAYSIHQQPLKENL